MLAFLSLHKNNVLKVSHYNTFNFLRKLCTPEISKMFVYKHTETIEHVKNTQTSRVNNWRFIRI